MPRIRFQPSARARVPGDARPVRHRPKEPVGRVVPLRKKLLRPAGNTRDWAAYDRRKVAQGALSWVLSDAGAFAPASCGPKGGRPAYPVALLCAAAVLRAADHLDLRATEGRLRDLSRLVGYTGPTPDHTTLCRRGAAEEVVAAIEAFLTKAFCNRRARRKGPVVVLIDSTGLTLCGPGGYLRDKHRDPRRGRYHILHVATDAATGEVLAHELTESTRCRDPEDHTDGLECTCPRVGDAPVAERLLARLVEAGVQVEALVGDGAYSGTPLRTAAGRAGTRVVAPLPVNAAYRSGSSPGVADRNRQLMAWRHLGAEEWKRRARYHVRSAVEADIWSIKASTGDTVNSKSITTARSEVAARIALRNCWLAA